MSQNKQINKRRAANKRKKTLKRKMTLRTKFMHEDIIPQHKVSKNKLSEVILDYAEPLTNDVDGLDEESKAISMSIIFWNASLMGKQEATESLVKFIDLIGNNTKGFKNDFYNIFNIMRERKQKYFKSDNRFIVNYSLSENDEGLYFVVASTPYKR
ncbi:MAG: hypothetical protein Q9N02_02850 [Ghiorsea sp.]|nr:hypothetical protein [Ghiorsea sp.]